MFIRAALETDLTAINEIYNESVRTSVFAFDTEETTHEQRLAWFTAHTSPYSVLVAQVGDETAGWASISPWAAHGAYAATAEHSIFVADRHRGHGVGRALLSAVVANAEGAGFHVLVGRITTGNTVSHQLHQRFGFHEIGTMREVGCKFGGLLDVWLVQKILPINDPRARRAG
jgi:L-amino acid N-acyltransferase YncA